MQMPIVKQISKTGPESMDLYSYQFQICKNIWLTGEITDETAMAVITQLQYLDQLDGRDIQIYINSIGGSVTAGLAIVDAIHRCQCDVITIATGMAASMGAMILACGTKGKRYATPLTDIMIHQPLGGVRGQASDIALVAEHIMKTKEKLNQLLADATEQTMEVIATCCDRDYHMDAEQAKSFGIIDTILTRNGN